MGETCSSHQRRPTVNVYYALLNFVPMFYQFNGDIFREHVFFSRQQIDVFFSFTGINRHSLTHHGFVGIINTTNTLFLLLIHGVR